MTQNSRTLDIITTRLQQKRKTPLVTPIGDEFDCTEKIYPFSNENVYDMMSKLDMKNKRILTVGSSGDQVLHAALLGAADITLIDSNPFSKLYTELKIAAIKNLPMADTYNYFTKSHLLSPSIYSKISHDLSLESREFWDHIMSLPLLKKRKFIREFAHIKFDLRGKDTTKYLLDPVSYYTLRKKLTTTNIHYVEADLHEFQSKATGTYDYIFLSNIFDYIKDHDDFFDTVTTLGKTKLRKGGKLQVNYDFIKGLRINYFLEQFEKHYGKDAVQALELNHIQGVPFHKGNKPFEATNIMLSKEFFDGVAPSRNM